MPKFIVEILYEPEPGWTEENKQYFDPPKNHDNPADKCRVYTTLIYARNEREAFRKARDGRREADPEKRIYDFNVVGHSSRRCP